MNAELLIAQIVRQTMVLIAQIATTGGSRAPLANVADRVFLDLARELEGQGISRKVSADMFGVALRSYRRRIQRLTESVTVQGRSLWSAVLDFVPNDRLVARNEVLRHFHRDDEAQMRGILSDLCESGLILKLGRGEQTAYRAASSDELQALERTTDGFEQFVWLMIYREGPISQAALLEQLRSDNSRLNTALQSLLEAGLVFTNEGLLATREVVVEASAPIGWEAAMFDHFRALVLTLCTRLRGTDDASRNGGSTYSFDVSPEHPLAPDVYDTLARTRRELSALRARVEAYNADSPETANDLVTVYVGQFIQTKER
jgi:hypothetical protein